MNEDKLKELLKESLVNTSDDFMDQLMESLRKKQIKQIQLRLNLLIFSVIAFFGVGAYLISRFGIGFTIFGYSLDLPKIGPLSIIVIVGCLIVSHIFHLIRMTHLVKLD